MTKRLGPQLSLRENPRRTTNNSIGHLSFICHYWWCANERERNRTPVPFIRKRPGARGNYAGRSLRHRRRWGTAGSFTAGTGTSEVLDADPSSASPDAVSRLPIAFDQGGDASDAIRILLLSTTGFRRLVGNKTVPARFLLTRRCEVVMTADAVLTDRRRERTGQHFQRGVRTTTATVHQYLQPTYTTELRYV